MIADIKLTPSRVREYLSCPLKFARLYGPAEEYPSNDLAAASSSGQVRAAPTSKALSATMSLSNTLHAALDTLHRPSPCELLGLTEPLPDQRNARDLSGLSEQELSSLVSRHWQTDGYQDSVTEETAYTQACEILRYYAQSEHTPHGQVLATEAYLTATTTLKGYRVELSCRADRIELHQDGVLEVLDYKLTKNGQLPSARALAEDLSSFVYFLLIGHHYKRHPGVRAVRISQLELMNLTKVEAEYDHDQVARHKEALAELVQSVMGGSRELEPHVSSACAWCPVQQTCPAWSEIDLDDITGLTHIADTGVSDA
ncbi:MAG TPA: PD-(D/E)XK nuclease family protein [Chloroflexia bacterium]|jgi:RecB family exonuclease